MMSHGPKNNRKKQQKRQSQKALGTGGLLLEGVWDSEGAGSGPHCPVLNQVRGHQEGSGAGPQGEIENRKCIPRMLQASACGAQWQAAPGVEGKTPRHHQRMWLKLQPEPPRRSAGNCRDADSSGWLRRCALRELTEAAQAQRDERPSNCVQLERLLRVAYRRQAIARKPNELGREGRKKEIGEHECGSKHVRCRGRADKGRPCGEWVDVVSLAGRRIQRMERRSGGEPRQGAWRGEGEVCPGEMRNRTGWRAHGGEAGEGQSQGARRRECGVCPEERLDRDRTRQSCRVLTRRGLTRLRRRTGVLLQSTLLPQHLLCIPEQRFPILWSLKLNWVALNRGGRACWSQSRWNRSGGRGSFGEVLLDASLDTVLGSFGSAPSSAFDRHN
eukprot:1056165-Rhodomonas_salina.1